MNSWMDNDLCRGTSPDIIESDVCVIGAGPVGLCVARALAEKHRNVTLLEGGPRRPEQQSDCQDIQFDRRPYRGATVGRAFGAGGTSALWGGQLLPMRETDLQMRSQISAPEWPIQYTDLSRHFAALDTWLQVAPGGFELPSVKGHPLTDLHWGEWAPRLSKWTPFGRRNIYAAFGPALAASRSIRGYLNAQAQHWLGQDINGRQRIVAVTAKSANGHTLSVRAKAYVICAGALESARCVLEMSEACGGQSNGVRELTGRFLHDHLSIRLARVKVSNHGGFQRIFAPIFVGKTMRSLRMELSNDYLSREGLPGLYAHFLFEAGADSGFALVREVLRGLQRARVADAFAAAVRIPQALPAVAELLRDRYLRRRLSFPRDAEVFLHCDFEQTPLRENRVYLAPAVASGRRSLRIDWDFGRSSVFVARAVQSAVQRFWAANALDRVAQLESVQITGGDDTQPTNLYDLYHPAGTTRMSMDPNDGVVDPNLLVHGTSNVFVAGSSVFPALGAANPTFTAMALGLRVAEFIHHRLEAE